MSRLLWLGAWIAIVVWSLIAAATYGIVDLLGSTAMRNADAFSTDANTVEWIFNLFSWARGLSVSVILVVWGVVSLAILSVPWLFDRLVASQQPRPAAPGRAWDGDGGVIDLGPNDYQVGRPLDHGGQAPRIKSSR
jgi:hypothetical protein